MESTDWSRSARINKAANRRGLCRYLTSLGSLVVMEFERSLNASFVDNRQGIMPEEGQ